MSVELDRATGQVETTDATPVNVITYTRSESEFEFAARVSVVARRSTHTTRYWIYNVCFKRTGGGSFAIVGSPSLQVTDGDAGTATWSVSFSGTTSSLLVAVTGAAAHTIRWTGAVELLLAGP